MFLTQKQNQTEKKNRDTWELREIYINIYIYIYIYIYTYIYHPDGGGVIMGACRCPNSSTIHLKYVQYFGCQLYLNNSV